MFQGHSGIRQIHVLLISSGDSCVSTLRAEEERQTEKKMFQCVVIASVVLENILVLWGRHLAPFGVGVGSESKGRSQEICHM